MHHLFSWYVTLTYSLIIFITSLLPLKPPPQIVFPFFDKVFHGLTYAILSFLAVNTFYREGKDRPQIYSFSYAFLLGLLIELIQFFLPYRDFEIADIFSNFLGSLLGCLVKII